MTQETNLLNVKIYKVQEAWTGQWGMKAANHAVKVSQRDIQFFCMVMPTKSPNIMELKGFTPPKPYIGEAAAPTAPGVERKDKIKAQS